MSVNTFWSFDEIKDSGRWRPLTEEEEDQLFEEMSPSFEEYRKLMNAGFPPNSREAICRATGFKSVCEKKFSIPFVKLYENLIKIENEQSSFARRVDEAFGSGTVLYVINTIAAFFKRRKHILKNVKPKMRNLSSEMQKKVAISKAPKKVIGYVLMKQLVLEEEKRQNLDPEFKFDDAHITIERPITPEQFDVIANRIENDKEVVIIETRDDQDDLWAISFTPIVDECLVILVFNMNVLGESELFALTSEDYIPISKCIDMLRKLCVDNMSLKDFEEINLFKPDSWQGW